MNIIIIKIIMMMILCINVKSEVKEFKNVNVVQTSKTAQKTEETQNLIKKDSVIVKKELTKNENKKIQKSEKATPKKVIFNKKETKPVKKVAKKQENQKNKKESAKTKTKEIKTAETFKSYDDYIKYLKQQNPKELEKFFEKQLKLKNFSKGEVDQIKEDLKK